jgi:hypothetical protein
MGNLLANIRQFDDLAGHRVIDIIALHGAPRTLFFIERVVMSVEVVEDFAFAATCLEIVGAFV